MRTHTTFKEELQKGEARNAKGKQEPTLQNGEEHSKN